jgi:hypothetical protein
LTAFPDVVAEGHCGVGKGVGVDWFQVVVDGCAGSVGAKLRGVGLEEEEEGFQLGVDDTMLREGLRAIRGADIGTDNVEEERCGGAFKHAIRLSIDHRTRVGSHQLLEGRRRRGLLRVGKELGGG